MRNTMEQSTLSVLVNMLSIEKPFIKTIKNFMKNFTFFRAVLSFVYVLNMFRYIFI